VFFFFMHTLPPSPYMLPLSIRGRVDPSSMGHSWGAKQTKQSNDYGGLRCEQSNGTAAAEVQRAAGPPACRNQRMGRRRVFHALLVESLC